MLWHKVLLEVEYDGLAYAGWQIQPQAITVERQFNTALFKIFQQSIELRAASRTDAQVSARGQVVVVKIPQAFLAEDIQRSLNALLPPDIVIRQAKPVPEDFCPRKNNCGKRYLYQIHQALVPLAIDRRFCWWVKSPLDLNKMRAASQMLLGQHDFKAFCAKKSTDPKTVKNLFKLEILQTKPEPMLQIVLEADGFLRHMVRIIVGSLVDIGCGRLDSHRLQQALKQPKRSLLGRTAPAHGLCLQKVLFNPDPL